MFDVSLDSGAKAQSSNLNEELGQVTYIFSDKTGTLTCNVMEFKRMSIGNYAYGDISDVKYEDLNPNRLDTQITNVNFRDKYFYNALANYNSADHDIIMSFLYHLAICHTIIIEEKVSEDGQKLISYNASSPDELALVNAARYFGFCFSG